MENEDLIKSALVLRIQPGDILLVEIADDSDLDKIQEFLKTFTDQGIKVLVHDSSILGFRVARTEDRKDR